MDIKNTDNIVKCGTMAEIRQNTVVIGVKQFKKALRDNRAVKAYLAQNADPALTMPVASMCKEHKIPVVWVRSMNELGRACCIDVGAAAVTVVK